MKKKKQKRIILTPKRVVFEEAFDIVRLDSVVEVDDSVLERLQKAVKNSKNGQS